MLVNYCLIFLCGGVLAATLLYFLWIRPKEKDLTKAITDGQVLEQKANALEERLSEENLRAETQRKEMEERHRASLKDQMEMLSLTFEKSASEILEKRAKDLGDSNERRMKGIIDPLKEQMELYKKEIEDAKKLSSSNAAALKENILSLMQQSASLGKEADNLAKALRGNNKIKGNWGENHLINILEHAGFRKGEDFDTQVTIRDSSGTALLSEDAGKKLIADVILHLPDEKCVIMDSKTSLDGYLEYTAAETDEERAAADRKHLESIQRHIEELSDKDYSSYLKKVNSNTLQYMIMYIPIEGAFQLFFQNHQEEWYRAYDKKIIITSDLYVITMLKVIQMAWSEYRRDRNYDRILDASRMLLDRVYGFTSTFDDIGKEIEKMSKSYENAKHRLHEGPQSIDRSYDTLVKLGVPAKKQLESGE